jgi:hypothetical protein
MNPKKRKKLKELLDSAQELLDMLEEREEFEKEFIESLNEYTAEAFLSVWFKDYPTIDKKLFLKLSLDKIRNLAWEFCDEFLNMYYHYEKTSEPFIKESITFPKVVSQLSPEEIKIWRDEFPSFSDEDFMESIQEQNDSLRFNYERELKLHGAVKKFITPYIEDCSHFPAIAYRELEFITWYYYIEIEQIMFKVGYELTGIVL